MARILLSRCENNFLREMLLTSIRQYQSEVSADEFLLSSCADDDDMKETYSRMLSSDKSKLSCAQDIYQILLSNLE